MELNSRLKLRLLVLASGKTKLYFEVKVTVLGKLSAEALRERLEALDQDTEGSKADLVARLIAALKARPKLSVRPPHFECNRTYQTTN